MKPSEVFNLCFFSLIGLSILYGGYLGIEVILSKDEDLFLHPNGYFYFISLVLIVGVILLFLFISLEKLLNIADKEWKDTQNYS